ncbi:MAG: hypothetical protein ACE5JI_15770, partial [Acidobacteriota bacterium]
LTFEQVRAAFPEEIGGEKVFDQIKDIPTLAKNYVEGQKYIGGAIKIPGEGASKEELAAFHQKLGVPEKVEDYGLKVEEGDATMDPAFLGRFLETAHINGISKPQAEALIRWWTEEAGSVTAEADKGLEQAFEALQTEWGGAAPRNIALAERAVLTLGGKEAQEFFDSSGLGNNPTLVKLFAKVGKMMAEEGLISGDVENIPGTEDAQKLANEIIFNKDHKLHEAYVTPDHPQHDEAVKEVTRLMQLGHPESV